MIWDLVIGPKEKACYRYCWNFANSKGLCYTGVTWFPTIIICQAVREINTKLVPVKSYVILYWALILMGIKRKKDRDGMEIEMEILSHHSHKWIPKASSNFRYFLLSHFSPSNWCFVLLLWGDKPQWEAVVVAFIDLWKDLDGGRLSKFHKCIAKCFKFLFSFYFLLELWNSISNTMRNKTFWGPELAFSVTMVLKNLNK